MIRSSSIAHMLNYEPLTPREQYRIGVQMRIWYRTARRLERRLEKKGPQRFLTEAIGIAKRRGDEARNTLVTSCLRWVATIAKKHLNNPRGLTFDELMSLGYCGLIHATQRWIPTRSRLLTYATWWIRQKMRRGGGYDYVPTEIRRGTRPMDPEVMAQIAKDESTSGVDKFIEADERQTKVAFVRRCLVELPDQQANVIRLRYLRGSKPTKTEVGDRIRVTRERVRQIEEEAIGKLSKHVRTPNQNWARRGCPAVIADASGFQTYQQRFAMSED